MKNYIIKMMGGDKYIITEETRNGLAGASGLCHLREIDTMINLNSISSITPEDKVEITEKTLYDGTRAIKKYGVWYDADNEGVKIDTYYYPELKGRNIPRDVIDYKKPMNGEIIKL